MLLTKTRWRLQATTPELRFVVIYRVLNRRRHPAIDRRLLSDL